MFVLLVVSGVCPIYINRSNGTFVKEMLFGKQEWIWYFISLIFLGFPCKFHHSQEYISLVSLYVSVHQCYKGHITPTIYTCSFHSFIYLHLLLLNLQIDCSSWCSKFPSAIAEMLEGKSILLPVILQSIQDMFLAYFRCSVIGLCMKIER